MNNEVQFFVLLKFYSLPSSMLDNLSLFLRIIRFLVACYWRTTKDEYIMEIQRNIIEVAQ